jgi:acetyltransferase-like isoleucine patch superfamily enzyme
MLMCIISFLKKLRIKILIGFNRTNISYKNNFSFGRGTIFYAPNKIEIGENVYIGKYCSIETDVKIGDNVLIANNCGLIGKYDHNFKQIGVPIKNSDWIGDINYNFKGKNLSITIENDVWIGFGSIVLSGITIGRGSIIAAGSTITNNVEPYSIYAGCPGKKIGIRFNKEEVEEHELRLNIFQKKFLIL